jgi:hypothetical protein
LLDFLDTKLTEMCYFPCLAVVAWPFTGALVVALACDRRRVLVELSYSLLTTLAF